MPNRQALWDMLNRIRERVQPYFVNRLEVGYEEASFEYEAFLLRHSSYYLAEKKYWLGIIPRKPPRKILTIHDDFFIGAGKKQVNCTVFERSVCGIVKEEVRKYADTCNATSLHIKHDFQQ
ncbi:MAG: hypothetical protein KGH79_01790 [Patescibacteria group bacterium]|nr:hypothetical protein [Patescibacteria group bacterium]